MMYDRNMEEKLWKVMDRLISHGHQAYIVGGAVRDILLDKKPKDYDICTDARPKDVIAIFSDLDMFKSGLKHGTVTIVIDHEPFEITTFRKDGPYRDGRHPDHVYFSDDVLDDLKRRDFTINAILMDIDEKIVDPLGGRNDILQRCIRAIGDPYVRFKEDHLRILRAIRFKAELDFVIDKKTEEAMFIEKDALKEISNERMADEFIKMVKSNDLKIFDRYRDILGVFIKYSKDVIDYRQSNDLRVRLALLFKDEPAQLDKLFLSKKVTREIKELIAYQNFEDDDLTLIFSKVDPELFISFIGILKGLDLSQVYDEIKTYIVNEKTLAIKANELMDMGYKGKRLGLIKKDLVKRILAQDLKNTHDDIMTYLKEVL